MMRLRSSPPSPFGRKTKIAAKYLNLSNKIEIEATETVSPEKAFLTENPLGKIPVLILEDGRAFYDSRVILEVLDHLAGGGRILPADPDARFAALTLQALADGLMDAALLQVYERRFRTEDKVDQGWLDRQAGKVARALAVLEAAPPAAGVDVGTIAVACALGYLDLRFAGSWRADHPNLVAWLDAFETACPAYGQTAPTA